MQVLHAKDHWARVARATRQGGVLLTAFSPTTHKTNTPESATFLSNSHGASAPAPKRPLWQA
eukprot:4028957-Lingulodinium_polyedra.AAC.1